MAINRYTRLTESEYNPLSLEEQIMVPLAKQKQQEDLLNNKDAVEAELNNLKRLQQDDPFVTEQTQKYKEQLDSIASSISDEGINRDTSRNFRKLYSDYKFDISESGDLGRAQKNYLTAKEKEKEARLNLSKMGHTQDKVNQLIEQGYSSFKGTVGEDGERNEFGNFDGPGYYSPEQEASKLYSQAASNGISIGKSGSDIQFKTDETTGAVMAVVTNTALTKEERDNAEQIADAYNSLMTSYSFGDRKAFADLYGYDQGKLTDLFTNLGGVFSSKIQKEVQDQRTSLQVVGKGNGAGATPTKSPGGSTWFSQQIYGKRGADSDAALRNRLTKNVSNTNREFYTKSLAGPIQDSRVDPNIPEERRAQIQLEYGRKAGSFQRGEQQGYSNVIDGRELQDIITSEGFGVHNGVISTADGKMIVDPLSNSKAVAIHGEYNGKKYALTVADPSLVNLVQKGATDPKAFQEARQTRNEMTRLTQDFRAADPFLSNKSDYEIAKAYENSIAESSNYIQTAHYTNNLDNAYYNEKQVLFGKKDNLASLTTRKVRITTPDGSELIDAKGEDAIDFLTKRLTGLDSDFSDLDIEEKNKVIEKLKNSGDLGYTPGDFEMANSLNFSLTDKDGNTVYMQVENNNELSGKNDRYPGIDDLSELQRYLIEGKHFVKKDKAITRKDGITQAYDQFFIQKPYLNENNELEIIPYVVYADKAAGINNYQQLLKHLDPDTMLPIEENGPILGQEDRNQVYDRVLRNMNTVYDNSVEQKTTNTEYGKRVDSQE